MNDDSPLEIKIGRTLGKLGRLHARRLDAYMDKLGLFRGQAFLLMPLSHDEGLTHSEIAEKLEISPAAATKVIKRMEALCYVQRRPDPSDERISRVFLQTEGWEVIQRIKNAFLEADQAMVRDLSTEEQETLLLLLSRVYSTLLADSLEIPRLPESNQ
jgi:MarR family transcriptional regulator, organic hydroperoxide resistance regulator